ncbi:MAG: response regulator [Gammaproteobacteria bacterium]|nr:response regulator [Gammaproteobacteria bacterium]MBQ0775110.1 response regulator [Gammaproteobacteria bacterium]|tara:strand:+ start:74002 stop:75015 length:1014 start_codon:yes stop_codon:yes gene_type:complete
MIKASILPYYYPTTVVLVDDNQRFLDNFTLHLDENLANICFSSANEALNHINDSALKVHLDQRCFSYYRDAQTANEDILRLDLTLIEREISDPSRFQDISVVIVDYDMPEMNGLDFCQKIRDRRVKKILLTGVADEKIAVAAFNNGIIDRFLMKSDPAITEKINQTIADCQRKYFSEVSALIQSLLALKSPEFIYNEDFIDYFFSIQKSHSFVEYYYVEDPSGFILVSDSGELSRLIIFSEAELQQYLFSIKKHKPPTSFIQKVSSGKFIPWLWETPEETEEDEPFVWEDYLYSATKLGGQEKWFCALIPNPPADIEYDSETSSYEVYLNKLDERSK